MQSTQYGKRNQLLCLTSALVSLILNSCSTFQSQPSWDGKWFAIDAKNQELVCSEFVQENGREIEKVTEICKFSDPCIDSFVATRLEDLKRYIQACESCVLRK